MLQHSIESHEENTNGSKMDRMPDQAFKMMAFMSHIPAKKS